MGLSLGSGVGGLLGNTIGGVYGAVLGGLGGAGTANLENGLGMNQPAPFSAPAMDPASANQVGQIENQELQTPQQNAQNIMQGTGAASNISNQQGNQQQTQQEEGGGGIPGMSAAISNKAQKNFSTSQGRLQQNANLQGQIMSNQNVNTATSNAISLYAAQVGVQSSVNNLQLQANAARYSTISQLMAGAGAIGGDFAATPSTSPNLSLTSGEAGSVNSIYNNMPMDEAPSGSGMGNYGLSSPGEFSGGNMGDYGVGGLLRE